MIVPRRKRSALPSAKPSTRARVQTGDNVMIGGIVINGTASKRILFRALGPSLAAAGVSGVLADPSLAIVDARGVTVAANNNWQDDAGNAAQVSAAGLAPSNPLESAVVVSLAPGGYTAIVRGVNDGTGVALIEAYELP